MRKLALLVVALLAANMTFAQKGIEFGLSFTPGSPWILNSEDFEEGDDLNYRGTFGYVTGLSLGYNFTDGMGVSSGIYYAQLGQNYINYNSAAEKAEMDVFARKLGYIRIPVLLKFSGDHTAQSSSFFRIGPHFDMLSSARYSYTDVESSTIGDNLFDVSFDEDMNPYTDLLNNEYTIYNSLAIGLTLEMGGRVNISEYAGIIFMLHMSGSFNTEAEDAGLVYPSTSSNQRQAAYNVMGGFTVGFNYVLGFE